MMNAVVPALESIASRLNGLGIWSTRHSVWGRTMGARTFDRSLYLWMHRGGLMGVSERRVLSELVHPGMCAVDVGANLGLYSLMMAALAGPAGRVLSFEPDPDLYALLVENCAANGAGTVEAHHMALGETSSRMTLNRTTLNSGNNHLGGGGWTVLRSPVEVEVAALDQLAPDLRPDFIKVDVQGWELKVLRGMEGILRASPKAVVYVEIWPEGLHRAGDSPEGLFAFFKALGFRFYACSDRSELDEAGFTRLAGSINSLNHVDLLASRERPAARA